MTTASRSANLGAAPSTRRRNKEEAIEVSATRLLGVGILYLLVGSVNSQITALVSVIQPI